MVKLFLIRIMKQKINIKFYTDEPSKPGKPNPTNWDKSFVDLEWEAPESDGGAPIESYIVEMRDKDERNWVKALTLPNK